MHCCLLSRHARVWLDLLYLLYARLDLYSIVKLAARCCCAAGGRPVERRPIEAPRRAGCCHRAAPPSSPTESAVARQSIVRLLQARGGTNRKVPKKGAEGLN